MLDFWFHTTIELARIAPLVCSQQLLFPTMASPFVRHFVDPLLQDAAILGGLEQLSVSSLADSSRKQKLRALLASLDQATTDRVLDDSINFLVELDQDSRISGLPLNAVDTDTEQLALQRALANRIVVALYAESMTTVMGQCIQLEEEADWWDEVERSRWNVAWYLLQSEFAVPQ